MITFIISLLALVAGYFIYGRIVERIFGPDNRPTPAVSKADGVDYIVMPGWKIFMIQFLNIAGTGPIFGAIMGAKFGPSAYLWIVFGCIFAGAMHDYLSGMLSIRHDGAGLPELVGHYLGGGTKKVMLVFSVFMLIMVGAVFVYSPALILGALSGGGTTWVYIWCGIIFVYYFLATMLPIDKIIGKIYPLFAIAMLFMAVALLVVLIIKWPQLPELTDGLSNMSPAAGPIFPCLFITIACGAISGFHATQSPLMARCMAHEKQGRPLFYGAMITEGIVALIWATVSSYFFYGGAAQGRGHPAQSVHQTAAQHHAKPHQHHSVDVSDFIGAAGHKGEDTGRQAPAAVTGVLPAQQAEPGGHGPGGPGPRSRAPRLFRGHRCVSGALCAGNR